MLEASALLRQAHARLAAVGVAAPRLDARLLLQAAAGVRADQLIAEPDQLVASEAALMFEGFIARRAGGEPVSRILGRREFHGVDFAITPAVLDPRPETEHLVAEVLGLGRAGMRFLDLGTGSGAIAVAVALAVPSAEVVAVDVSGEALAVAQLNAEAAGVGARIAFLQSHWFQHVVGRFDIIASNPPYIPTRDIAHLSLDVRAHDPHLALDGGEDGLDCYRAIGRSAAHHLAPRGHVIVEIGHDQKADVTGVFERCGFRVATSYQDYAGLDRGLAFALT